MNDKKIIVGVEKKNGFIRDLVFLTVIIGLLFGIMLGSFPLAAPDGARYAEIPREMVVSHDYITPHLNGLKYFEKPPLFYWAQVFAIKAFGLSEWSVNLVNAAFAFFTCLLVYLVGRKIYSRRTGILASLILATSGLFFVLGRIITLDMALTFFLSTVLFLFILGTRAPPGLERKFYMWTMYIAAALAVMTKGLVGLFLPALIIGVWILFFNEWRNLKTYCIFTGSILFLLVAVPWHVLVQLKNPEFFNFYFFEQHFLRYFTPYAGREQPFWFFTAIFLVSFFPWIFFLPQVIKAHLPKKIAEIKKFKMELFLLIWPLLIFLFYNFSSSKLATYILPILPPLAILMGDFFDKIMEGNLVVPGSRGSPMCLPIRRSIRLLCITALVLGFGALSAIYLMDFSKTALTSMHFYLIGTALILMALVTYVAYKKYNLQVFLVTLIVSTMVFLLAIAPGINISNKKSIKPLVELIAPTLTSADEVVSFESYYQDLPYYLQRIITVVDFYGELELGIRYTPGADKWMINKKDFWKLWKSKKRVFVLANVKSYASIRKNILKSNKYLLGTYLNTVLFTNRP